MWKRSFSIGWTILALSFLADCAAPRQAASPLQPTSANWEKEIAAFESADRAHPAPQNGILFIGSSSIRLWKSLAADFPGAPVINRGFGGSQIIDSACYADRIVVRYHPRLIVFYAGGNDINAGKSPEQVFADYRLFVHLVRHQLPSTRIACISIAPNPLRWAQVDKVRETNRLIQEYSNHDRHLEFIDVFPEMLGPDGQPKPDIYREDRLHMNARGYEIWKRVIRPYLSL